MESLTSGTFVGAGSFRCRRCGYVLTLVRLGHAHRLPGLRRPGVRARVAVQHRAMLPGGAGPRDAKAMLSEPPPADHDARLAEAREQIDQPGEYLCYEEGGELRTVALTREWTRIGRSLAADVRFDDPTVSRRHALIVRQPDGVRVLDDRSLNGVFVNGARVEGQGAEGRRRDHRRPLPPELPERRAAGSRSDAEPAESRRDGLARADTPA